MFQESNQELPPDVKRPIPKRPDRTNNTSKLVSQRGRLSTKGEFNFGIPTQQGAEEHIEEHHGSDSWRMKVLEFLHQDNIQIALMCLLLSDVLILFLDLILLTQYPSCTTIERDCISCCEPAGNHSNRFLQSYDYRFLAEDDHEDICDSGLEPNFDTGTCDSHKWNTVHTVEDVLFWCTIVILTVLYVELNVQMVAIGPAVFFCQFFYALDYFIVSVSLGLELILYAVAEESLATVVGLVIFARLWRFVRIGHGIIEVTSELTHQQYEDLIEYTKELLEVAENQNLEVPPCPASVRATLDQDSTNFQHSESQADN